MQATATMTKLAQPFCPVKYKSISDTLHSPNPMIHHKSPRIPERIIVSYSSIKRGDGYGVSRSRRVLSPQRLLKRFDQVRDCLESTLGLTTGEREVVLRLLRLWAYYGKVYAKASFVCTEPGCSKATFWRTIRKLKVLGFLHVHNRFVIRPHAQISNLYRLDRLVLLLARYLAEHGTAFWEKWLIPWLAMPGRSFWPLVIQSPEARAGPGLLTYFGSQY